MLALITGGDRGIGFAIAKKLAENGIDLILVARNREKLDNAAKSIDEVKVHTIVCDLENRKQIEKLGEMVKKIGRLDILINNAGVAYRKNFLENSEEEIDSMINVNLAGLIYCTKALAPNMVANKRGTIINVSSGAGKYGFPELAVYCATKFAVIGFTESFSREVADHGVKVYAVCPGSTETDMWRSLYPGRKAEDTPEKVANVVWQIIQGKFEPGSAVEVYNQD